MSTRRFPRPHHLHHAGNGRASGADRPARHAAERVGGAQILRLGGAAGRLHGADHPGLCRLREISGAEAASGRAAVADPRAGARSCRSSAWSPCPPISSTRRSAAPRRCSHRDSVALVLPVINQFPFVLVGPGRRGGDRGRARRRRRTARVAWRMCSATMCITRCSIAAPRPAKRLLVARVAMIVFAVAAFSIATRTNIDPLRMMIWAASLIAGSFFAPLAMSDLVARPHHRSARFAAWWRASRRRRPTS